MHLGVEVGAEVSCGRGLGRRDRGGERELVIARPAARAASHTADVAISAATHMLAQ